LRDLEGDLSLYLRECICLGETLTIFLQRDATNFLTRAHLREREVRFKPQALADLRSCLRVAPPLQATRERERDPTIFYYLKYKIIKKIKKICCLSVCIRRLEDDVFLLFFSSHVQFIFEIFIKIYVYTHIFYI